MAITVALVRTNGRVAVLRRCLDMLRQKGSSFKKIVVMDDDDSGPNNCDTRRLVEAYRTSETQLQYQGYRERQKFMAQLSAVSGVDSRVVSFGLSGEKAWGVTDGAAMNTGLLGVIGENVLSVDDDIILAGGRSPNYVDAIRLYPATDPRSLRFYESHEAAIASIPEEEFDLTSAHEKLLGKSLCQRVRSSDAQEGTTVTTESQIIVTMSGLAGDCGSTLPVLWPSLSGVALSQSWESEAHFALMKSSRSVVRVAPCFAITSHPGFMAFTAGMLNDGKLPPFPPVFRNSDGVFGVLIASCRANSYFGHVPWTVIHAPIPHRQHVPNGLGLLATRKTAASVLMDLVWFHTLCEGGGRATTNMERLGEFLISVAKERNHMFRSFVQRVVEEGEASRIRSFERRLEAYHDVPIWWLNDTYALLNTIRENSHLKMWSSPWDSPDLQTQDEKSCFQSFVHGFGALLCNWSCLVDAARIIRPIES